MGNNKVYTFDEFFESGLEESISPFLEKKSRKWSKNLPLKTALFCLFLLILSYTIVYTTLNSNIAYLLLCFIYLFVGVPALLDALEDLKNFEINISILMTLAGFLAILLNSPLEGALLLILFNISDSLEKSISYRTKSAIFNLNKIAPTKAFVVNDDKSFSERSIKDIALNTKILIKAGEIVPLDGKIIEGYSEVNQVHLTGESMPVEKKVNDMVYAGTINIDGSLTITVTKTSGDSTISRIIKLINEATDAKPKIQRWLDKFGKIYSTIVILLSFIFAAILPFIFNITYLGKEGALYRAIAFLIASSPCALIIGAPLAYLTAISSLAKKGIMLKGGFILDAIRKCKNIAFDKTGTLTTGDFVLSSFEQTMFEQVKFDQAIFDKEKALAIADSLERKSTHPIAKAIHTAAKDIKHDVKIIEFKSDAGFGIQGVCEVENKKYKVYIGKLEYIEKFLEKVLKTEIEKKVSKKAKTLSFMLIDNFLFILTFSDEIRKNSFSLIENLKKTKNLIMLTGDNSFNANFVAQKLGIENVFANQKVEDKLKLASEYAKNGLVMIGDGINDAPALSRATVGISLGKVGSATAINASDVILLNDDISLISYLLKKASFTSKIAKQNLIFALLIIVLAAIPSLLGLIPLWLAVLLHEGSSVLVGLNCLRLIKH
ncbi:MAG: putative cadmium-transporting ATPase [Candidatus Anoxychlamydiales bacterium]|nr:putative cadmium-transporting ATPase [Candidatus Anoxychlamydiales bacterium]